MAEFAKATEKKQVVHVEAETPWGVFQAKGQWRVLDSLPYFATRDQSDLAWKAFGRPGVKEVEQEQLSKSILSMLKADTSYDTITLDIPAPQQPKAGDRHDFTVIATLSDGTKVSTHGTMIAQSITAPSGWILGDTHVHTDLEVLATLQHHNIRDLALAYGHHFTYVTDHIDLIRISPKIAGSTANEKWANWYTKFSNFSSSTYTMSPGIEVTANDLTGNGIADGDVLGYGVPSTNPTGINNLTMSMFALVSGIRNSNLGVASVYAAHPDGGLMAGIPTEWINAGYDGAQAIDHGQVFWQNSINNGYTTAASGGSDAHVGLAFNGESTWVYAPNWSSSNTWSSKVGHIAEAMRLRRTSASSDGSFGYFQIHSQLPGGAATVSTGSTILYNIDTRALNNGFDVRITWDLYRGSTRVNGGTSAILPSGGSFVLNGLSTVVQSGKQAYYLKVRFDYMDAVGTVFSSEVLSGPTYITGN